MGIARGTDMETERQAEGGLPHGQVDALCIVRGDSARLFRMRRRIESCRDTRRMVDRAHTALQQVIDATGIECPLPTQTLDVKGGWERGRTSGKQHRDRTGSQLEANSGKGVSAPPASWASVVDG